MTLRSRPDGPPVLLDPAAPVATWPPRGPELIDDMLATMAAADGIGSRRRRCTKPADHRGHGVRGPGGARRGHRACAGQSRADAAGRGDANWPSRAVCRSPTCAVSCRAIGASPIVRWIATAPRSRVLRKACSRGCCSTRWITSTASSIRCGWPICAISPSPASCPSSPRGWIAMETPDDRCPGGAPCAQGSRARGGAAARRLRRLEPAHAGQRGARCRHRPGDRAAAVPAGRRQPPGLARRLGRPAHARGDGGPRIWRLPVRRTIALLVRTRLELLTPHREAIRRAAAARGMPGNLAGTGRAFGAPSI